MIDLSKEKLILDYPCNWEYRLVVLEHIDIKKSVREIILEREYKIKSSKTSTKGKFISYTLELLVHNEDDRKELYELLKQHKDMKMVL